VTRFVDVHVHPPATVLEADGYRPYLDPAAVPAAPATFEELADHYRDRDGIALVHAFDAGSVVGSPALGNARLARLIEPHSDVLFGLGSVDPHLGEAAVMAAHDAVRLGLRGLFLHPAAQKFDPTGRRSSPLWGIAEDLGFPVVVHTGATVLGAGLPGGAGISLDVMDPLKLDRIAAGHPDLSIVLAGVTPPWEATAAAVAAHKPNVHLALSGGLPGDLGEPLRSAAAGPLAAKAMCGTGFPFLTPDEWLEDWERLGASDDATRAVLTGNAAALFRLGEVVDE
jgi:predicted TIM-barrel fold metal-dependent hydrolase